MYYLAFDQATNDSGYSVFKDTELIEYGKFKTTESTFHKKLEQSVYFFEGIIDKYKEQGKVKIGFEDVQLQSNADTFKKLSNLQGACIFMAIRKNDGEVPEIVHSATWKSFSSIRGKSRGEQKRNAQNFILDMYGVKVTQDEADAILIGRCMANKELNWE